MKGKMIAFLSLLSLLAALNSGAARTRGMSNLPVVQAQSGCTNDNLTGNYGLTFNGFEKENDRPVPCYRARVATADSAVDVSDISVFPLDGLSSNNKPYSGTYTVNPDSAVVTTATPGSDRENLFGGAVSATAEVFGYTDTSTPDTVAADLKKQ